MSLRQGYVDDVDMSEEIMSVMNKRTLNIECLLGNMTEIDIHNNHTKILFFNSIWLAKESLKSKHVHRFHKNSMIQKRDQRDFWLLPSRCLLDIISQCSIIFLFSR